MRPGLGIALGVRIGPRPRTDGGGGAAAAAISEIWLGWGDSLSVGNYAADRSIDTYGTNVWTVRQRAPTGLSNVSLLSPMDQAQNPTGTDYLSPEEIFSNQRSQATGAPVCFIGHGRAGSSLYDATTNTTGTWGVGISDHEGFVTRANAAIQTVQAAYPNAFLAGIVQFMGSNNRGLGNSSGFQTNLLAAIADMRARIFQNGISGADASALPYIINGMIPEGLTAPGYINYELVLRSVAASITNGKFFKMPEGITSDNLHPTAAANRTVVGPGDAALLTDKTPPVIGTVANYTSYTGQNMLIELTADKYVKWTLSGAGASDYEIVDVSDGVSGLGLTRVRQYLRWAGDGTKAIGTYGCTITAKDGAGNTTSINRVDTVIAAYGLSSTGPVTQTVVSTTGYTKFNGATANATTPISFPSKFGDTLPAQAFGAGLNLLIFQQGSAPVSAIKVAGVSAVRVDPGATSGTFLEVWAVPLAQGGNHAFQVWTSSTVAISNPACSVVCLTNSKALPTSSDYYTSPVQPTATGASLTIGAGGSIIGIGTGNSGDPVASPAVTLQTLVQSSHFVAYRTSSGSISVSGSGKARQIISLAFDQA